VLNGNVVRFAFEHCQIVGVLDRLLHRRGVELAVSLGARAANCRTFAPIQHPELNEDDARLSFADLIKGGIDQGFAQARDILDGVGVLEGDIASAIDATYSLVMQGLEAFRAAPEASI
jgi:hypothetical protein